jgi:hypothetical protein
MMPRKSSINAINANIKGLTNIKTRNHNKMALGVSVFIL